MASVAGSSVTLAVLAVKSAGPVHDTLAPALALTASCRALPSKTGLFVASPLKVGTGSTSTVTASEVAVQPARVAVAW